MCPFKPPLSPDSCLASSFCPPVCLSVCRHWQRAVRKAQLVHCARRQLSVLSQLLVFPQGFLPTLLEDVPDMAVKFAVFETLKPLYARLTGNRPVRVRDGSPCSRACLPILHCLECMRLVGPPLHITCNCVHLVLVFLNSSLAC